MSWKAALSRSMCELRVYLCHQSPKSAGVRDFLVREYAELKHLNPKFPIMVREGENVEAKITARYDFAAEHTVNVDGLSASEVASQVKNLVIKGQGMPKPEPEPLRDIL
eukprot:tig00000076_g2371.t1